MKIQTTIDNVRSSLITEFAQSHIPSRIQLGTGNIFQVGIIQSLHQESNMCIQLAYEGTVELSRFGGGNWSRDWLLGVGIYVETSQDILDQNTQAAQDTIYIAQICSQIIHMYDDFAADEIVSTNEIIEQISESTIDLISINDHEYLTIRQQYRILGPIYGYTEFKAIN